jgi:putative ABC transport system permease protein
MMMLRNIGRHPLRAAFTVLGIALAAAILIVSLFTRDTTEQLVNVTYFLADRQDARLSFPEKRARDAAVFAVMRLPGVIAVEPYREVPALIRHGHVERRLTMSGRPRDADLSQIIDVRLRPVILPEAGLAISDMLGKILGVQVGDFVEVDLLDEGQRTFTVQVAALVEDYIGLRAMMDAESLSRLMSEAPAVNGVNVSIDESKLDFLYEAIKRLPTVSGMALQRFSLGNFRTFVARIIRIMASIYIVLAAVIAFGVVYNSARISLSERARELASLRVLGFTNGEVLRILLLEIAVLVLIAQPPGWFLGYWLSWIMQRNIAGEMMRARLVVETPSYVYATVIVLVATFISALVVRRRVKQLDLVAVLKTRD